MLHRSDEQGSIVQWSNGHLFSVGSLLKISSIQLPHLIGLLDEGAIPSLLAF